MPSLPNLRRVRNGYPLTIRELAARSGVSHDTITKIENGHRQAQPRTTRKIAEALGVEARELMKEGE